MNMNEECLLKYLQNPDELIDLTALLLELTKLPELVAVDI